MNLHTKRDLTPHTNDTQDFSRADYLVNTRSPLDSREKSNR
jgi:hypothetical protein